MDAELSLFLTERFDAIERRLDRIEHQLCGQGHDGCQPCCRTACRSGERCERCQDHRDHGGRCRRCGCPGCCGRCGRCENCRCGGSGGRGCGGADGTLRAFGEAQALLAAFERARDDSLGHGLEQVRESLRLLSRRVSALERSFCCGQSTC